MMMKMLSEKMIADEEAELDVASSSDTESEYAYEVTG